MNNHFWPEKKFMTKLITVVRNAMDGVYDDLCAVEKSCPNEVLPKEEQIRSSMYKHLCNGYKNQTICVERTYPYKDGCRKKRECDIWFRENSGRDVWIELKRTACIKTWVTPTTSKNGGKASSWVQDVDKLKLARKTPGNSCMNPANGLYRIFVLYAFMDVDINTAELPKRVKTFLSTVNDWLPKQCGVLKKAEFEAWTYDFTWLQSPVRYMSVFAWIW